MMAINPDESLAPMQMPASRLGSTVSDLLAETCQYLAPEDMERIERAYELARRAHMGVRRLSGEAYIQHPLEVALLLADMRIDADGIVAALLHDVVEDTTFSLEISARASLGRQSRILSMGSQNSTRLSPARTSPFPGRAGVPYDDLQGAEAERQKQQDDEQRSNRCKS